MSQTSPNPGNKVDKPNKLVMQGDAASRGSLISVANRYCQPTDSTVFSISTDSTDSTDPTLHTTMVDKGGWLQVRSKRKVSALRAVSGRGTTWAE